LNPRKKPTSEKQWLAKNSAFEFSKRSIMKSKGVNFCGKGVEDMRTQLTAMASQGDWPLLDPLPATRLLGAAFGVSNVSAYRVLAELSGKGLLWRAPNGRYFQASAQRLLERPLPVACLFRHLEKWTALSRDLLLGADDACGDLERALLLMHDRVLFRQSDPAALTISGTDDELSQSLEDFLNLYGSRTHGVLLDELWPDRVLKKLRERMVRGVVLCRSTSLPFLGSVCPDTNQIANMVVAHALERGFARMVILIPFEGYAQSEEVAAAVCKAVKNAKSSRVEVEKIFFHPATTLQTRLAKSLKNKKPTLLVATEDNMAVSILELLQNDTAIPESEHGLLSTMGTEIAREKEITCIGTDFRKLGEAATQMAISGQLATKRIKPDFFQGSTT
jgi:hypothetical protein